MGGVLMIIACILEFIIGNTFTGVSFGTYGMNLSLPRSLLHVLRPLNRNRWFLDCPGNHPDSNV